MRKDEKKTNDDEEKRKKKSIKQKIYSYNFLLTVIKMQSRVVEKINEIEHKIEKSKSDSDEEYEMIYDT